MNLSYTLLFLDLDGTLVGKDDRVSPRTIAALNRAVEIGCLPVICTGRNRYMVESIAAQWSGHGYAILSNGAVIAEWESGRVLRKTPVPLAIVQQAARIAHAFEAAPLCFGVHVEDDGGQTVYTDTLFPVSEIYLYHNSQRMAYCENLETVESIAPVGVGVYGPRAQIERLAHTWRQSLGPGAATFVSFDARYDCWCAFLNSSEADKAVAAKHVSKMLGVPRERTMAIGDHLNDLDLLKWVGMGVCIGDGHEEAQACARHITGTFAEDGAAQAIERFILKTESAAN